MLPFVVSSGLSTFLGLLGTWGKSERKKYGPCTQIAQVPTETPFELPVDNVCPNDSSSYYMAYFSPASNPFFVPTGPNPYDIVPYSNVIINAPFFRYKESTWNTLLPNGPINSPFPQANVIGTNFNSAPLNMCPQKLLIEAENQPTKTEALAVPLPIIRGPAGSVDGNLTSSALKLWVIPGTSNLTGLTLGTDINVPVNKGATAGATAASKPFPNGLSSTLYIYAVKDVTIFIELGGARGGNVEVYANGVNPITGVGVPLDPSYVGGNRGVVHGLYTLQANEVLKVFLGSVGQELGMSDVPSFGGNGQSGIGTIFGGANGGGASYICHFTGTDALDNAFADTAKYSKLICVAGGGGGSSRNASGGSAGFTDNDFKYGEAPVAKAFGSSGGKSYALGPAPYLPGLKTNEFSGGGGVETSGGQSNVTEPTEPKSSYGKRIAPFKTDGGGSVVTESGSGGGGGGGGLYGGGAGGFNGLPKPNNIHGAGGGGSSWTGFLQPATTGTRVSLNCYRNETWANIPKSKSFPQSYAGYSDFGYIVIGLPNT